MPEPGEGVVPGAGGTGTCRPVGMPDASRSHIDVAGTVSSAASPASSRRRKHGCQPITTGIACSAAVTVIVRVKAVAVSAISWVTVPPNGQWPPSSRRSEPGPVSSHGVR